MLERARNSARQVLLQKPMQGEIPAAEQLKSHWNFEKLKRDSRSLTIFTTMLAGAAGGRILLQYVPSVEPIIPLAILAGMLFGMREGFALGGSAYIISNFFLWGLQGPWTIFQALGGAMAGAMGGAFGKMKSPKPRDLIFMSIAGTVLFEVIMNLSGPMMGIGFFIGALSIPLYFLSSAPFSIIHIATNAGFAALLRPLLKLKEGDNEFKVVSLTRADARGSTTLRMYKSGRGN